MDKNKESIDSIVGDYKYGFTTDAKTVLTSGKGLNREVVEFISKAKNELLINGLKNGVSSEDVLKVVDIKQEVAENGGDR